MKIKRANNKKLFKDNNKGETFPVKNICNNRILSTIGTNISKTVTKPNPILVILVDKLGNLFCNVLTFESKFDNLSIPEYKNIADNDIIHTAKITFDIIEIDSNFFNIKFTPRKL